MQLPPDHRLKRPSVYNRQETIDAVTSFYQLLTKLPFIEPSDIFYPPPEGWPHITQETFACLNKTYEVIELLRHLPYINSRREKWQIIPETAPIDYVTKGPLEYLPFVPDDYKVPPWVINLTHSGRHGQSLMFDTSDGTSAVLYIFFPLPKKVLTIVTGTVTEHNPSGGTYDPDYEKGDPRYWRVECDDETTPLVEYLDRCKQKYLDSMWFPQIMDPSAWPTVYQVHPLFDEYTPQETKVCSLC